MLRDRVTNRLVLVAILLLVMLVASACYKDAGEDLQPTSGQVNLTDIAPTATEPPPTPTATETLIATPEPAETATRTLVPTTTPADFATEVPTVEPTDDTVMALDSTSAASDLATNTPGGNATPTQFVPNAATQAADPTATPILITTPGMSDILPSPTPIPTIDLTNAPTPTAIPIEENPCIHVVSPSDTLYSIARDNEVLLTDLVAANPDYLGGSAATVLQLGWQLAIPGCELPGQEGVTGTTPVGTATATTQSDGPITHVVQSGEGLYAIARLYGVDVQAIIDANNLINPNLIYPGDTLIIPVGQ